MYCRILVSSSRAICTWIKFLGAAAIICAIHCPCSCPLSPLCPGIRQSRAFRIPCPIVDRVSASSLRRANCASCPSARA
ncbi:hypothetical protein B0H14DRAFT_2756641 [Mycena olivaceomarginata]|nr:hypothetical protein B0H14DRAFT_2756641 [Mycena olivaceomarginata]